MTLSDLYERHAGEIAAYCARLVGPGRADDAVGDAWLRAVQGWPGYRECGRGRAWLFTLARSACYDLLRADGRRPTTELDNSHATELPDVDARIDAQRLATALLTRLTAPQQQAVRLCADGYGWREAANLMGCTPVAYRAYLYRARKAVRK